MKNRIRSLLLALITLLQIVPWSVMPVWSGDNGIDVSEMEVGKLYRAIFKTEEETGLPDICVFNESMWEFHTTVMKSSLPQDLIVKKMEEGDVVVYVTNEVWVSSENGDLDEYRYIEAHEIHILEKIEEEPVVPDDGLVRGEVGLVIDGEVVEKLTISKGEKTYVFTDLSDKIEGTPTYIWQMLIDRENNRWATVQDYVYPYAPVSDALIANACANDSVATLRCIVNQNGVSYVSGEVEIAVERTSTSNDKAGASDEILSVNDVQIPQMLSSRATNDAFQIVVNYVYWNNSPLAKDLHGQAAAETFTVTLYPGTTYEGEKKHPYVPGYKAYIRDDENGTREYEAQEDNGNVETHKYSLADPIVFEDESEGREVTVYYLPEIVPIIVHHHIQNLNDDGYTELRTTFTEGYSDYSVGDKLYLTEADYADIVGFNGLFYDNETRISSNGDTEINIYYDRNYYLVDFDLTAPDGSKGYGVMPLYVRYGTSLASLGVPTVQGYAFDSWTLTSVYNSTERVGDDGHIIVDKKEIDDPLIRALYSNTSASLSIKHNVSYKAEWRVATTSYTVAYWWQNADPTTDKDGKKIYEYSVWKTVSKTNKNPGDYVTATDLASFESSAPFDNIYGTVSEKIYFTYNADKSTMAFTKHEYYDSQGVQVKGDGSTVINVYYDRIDYELRFYYAMSSGSGDTAKYYIVGGSTYYFGAQGYGYDTNDEKDHLDRYIQTFLNDDTIGHITALPTYDNSDGRYTYGNLESKVNNVDYLYHYISFKAKYGADISKLWPVDVFDPVTRLQSNANGSDKNWPHLDAYVSAWNGEHHVYYSQTQPNQTIKGRYEILDHTLLWDYRSYGKENGVASEASKTVSYLCYWLNGSKTGWSIPSLFEYNLVLPGIDGTSQVITYNVYDNYDPAKSDANPATDLPKNHLHPSMEGFTKQGSISYERIAIPDGQNYQCAYRITFNYTRNSHALKFDDQYTRPVKENAVPYGTDLSQFASYEPAYPSALEKKAYTFGGWYMDEQCTVQYIFNKTMPDKTEHLYAKWVPTTWDVKIYQEDPKNAADAVLLKDIPDIAFGSILTSAQEPERTPPNDGRIFAGWYYMDGQNEERFDFHTMPIKQDYVIYAKWISEVPVPYTVRYVTIKDGNEIEIAEPTTGVSLADHNRFFIAKVDQELNQGYQTGYFPTVREMNVKMQDGENIITFEYVTGVEIPYQIQHVFQSDDLESIIGTDTLTLTWSETAGTDSVSQLTFAFNGLITYDSVIQRLTKMKYTTYQAERIWGVIMHMSPDAYNQRLILLAPAPSDTEEEILAKNTVVFNWSERYDMVPYEIHHRFENLDGSYTEIPQIQTYTAQYEEDNPQSINFNGLVMTVKGFEYLGNYETNHPNGNQNTTLITPTATQAGLIITVYYKREKYDYIVKYYDSETNEPIKAQKNLSDLYETEISILSVMEVIDGYDLANGNDIEQLIFDGQEIICYYTRQTVKYEYVQVGVGGSLTRYEEEVSFNHTPLGSIPLLAPGYVFDGWFSKDANGNLIEPEGATVDNGGEIRPNTAARADVGKTYTYYAVISPTSLTITNNITLDNGVPDWVTDGQGFIYTITGEGVSLRVAVIDSVTIKGLPAGSYTVTVENAWSWRYAEQSQNVVVSGAAQTVTFTYEAPYRNTNSGYYVTGQGSVTP